jgi:hypothetical protein
VVRQARTDVALDLLSARDPVLYSGPIGQDSFSANLSCVRFQCCSWSALPRDTSSLPLESLILQGLPPAGPAAFMPVQARPLRHCHICR